MYEIENEDHINMALEAGEDNVEEHREGLGKLLSLFLDVVTFTAQDIFPNRC